MGVESPLFFNPEYIFYVLYEFFYLSSTSTDDGTEPTEVVPEVIEEVVEVSEVSTSTSINLIDSSKDISINGVLIWDILSATLIIVSLILLVGIVYAVIRMSQIRKQTRLAFETHRRTTLPASSHRSPKEALEVLDSKQNAKWRAITVDARSNDPLRWMVALREATIFLNAALAKRGVQGDTLDEKLNQIPDIDHTIVSRAAEGHAMWEGVQQNPDDILTQKKTLTVLDLYKPLLVYLGEI